MNDSGLEVADIGEFALSAELVALAKTHRWIAVAARANGGRGTFLDFCLARRITLRRELMEVSQEELAHMVGADVDWVRMIETNIVRVKPDELVRIARALNTSLTFFYRGLEWSRRRLLLADGQRSPV